MQMNKRRRGVKFVVHGKKEELGNRSICLMFDNGECMPVCVSGEYFDLDEAEMTVNRVNAYLGLPAEERD